MLVPAILYKEEIIKNMQKYFYTDDMMYETGCMDNWTPNIIECPENGQFQYAIVDKNEKMVEERQMGAMGPLMGMSMKQLKGKADGSLVNKIVREEIQKRI